MSMDKVWVPMQKICAFEYVSWFTVASLVIYLLREQNGKSQGSFSGNHSKWISNISVALAFIAESMTAVHGTATNQVLHYDFLYVQRTLKTRNQPTEYVLVVMDDLSGFVGFILATVGDHFVVGDALVQWYSRFGMP
jgi:hypothetical protein